MSLFSLSFSSTRTKKSSNGKATAKAATLALLVLGAAGAFQTPVAAQDRRIVTIDDADFFGSDYNTVKDVDLEGCKSACLRDSRCRAFTFNTSAGWCFLKSDYGELQRFAGAIAGRVVEVKAPRADLSADRKRELTFLSPSKLQSAETYSLSIANSARSGGGTADQLRQSGSQALRSQKAALAEADFLQLIALEPGDYQAWAQLTIALLMQKPDGWTDRQNNQKNAVSAAINTYLRTVDAPEQAATLGLLARALERRSEYKTAIKALRASLAYQENPNIRRHYDELVAKHGFRIVDHEVDSDSVAPRICLIFSQKLPLGEDMSPYVTVKGEGTLSVEAEGNQICADGLKHGARYQLTARSGLPAADGEKLEKSSELSVYVRDRSPSVHFLSRSYVLPSGGNPTIPIVSVNTSEVETTIYRVGGRSVADILRDNRFLRQLSSYQAERIEDELGEKVWSGIVETENSLNLDITTAIPVSETGIDLKPGVYVMTARSKLDLKNRWGDMATQWFLVSDLGLTAFSGDDGLSANIRSLSTADALEGVNVRLLAVNNENLGEAVTDSEGFADFAAGLTRGRGGRAPGVLVAETGEGDYSFLDLRKPAFDLSDRGVEGRPAPGPLDVFAWTDRGIYKAGETVHAQALLRTAKAVAQEDFPLTFVFSRPDGVEHARYTVTDSGLGGHLQDLSLSASAQQGMWSWRVFTDPKGSALAEKTFLVEDYQPERVDFDLETAARSFGRGDPTKVSLEARFLYGSPASGQTLEGDIIVRPVRKLEAYPGYIFGLKDTDTYSDRNSLPSGLKTDEDGRLSFDVTLPQLPETTLLYDGQLVARLVEAGGRYVERTLDLPVALDGPRIGVKPAFSGGVDEGGPADFSVIVVGTDGEAQDATGLNWTLSRVSRRYQWYRLDGRWNYEPITTSKRVASGELDLKAAQPGQLSLPVEWGEYRLDVEGSGALQTATSVTFNAGWYTADATSDTPDYLDVGLDRSKYRPGDTAKLRLKPQTAGTVVVNVVSGGVVSSRTVKVDGEETEIDIPVGDDWGAGAYITASLYRPMDLDQKRMPSRAIGLSWLQVDPGDRVLDIELSAPERILPETTLEVPIRLANLDQGEQAYVTVAAVDVGILNLTKFETPDPDGWYFGQRRLGTDVRDLYGQLIDRMAGTMGRVRSGGDGMGLRLDAPPPDEEPLALFSGLVEVGPDGKATVSFEIPAFNGAVKLMAVAWTREAVGHADQEVEVRAPVVVTASTPAFLAPGDQSRITLEIDNVDGAPGSYELEVSTAEGLLLADGVDRQNRTLEIDQGKKSIVLLPLTAGASPLKSEVVASLSGPDGKTYVKRVGLEIRNTQPEITRRSTFALAPGGELTLSADSFDGLQTDTVEVTLSAGGAANIDIAGLLAALDRYPYGCTEQTTSRALPLLYLSEVAEAAGLGTDSAIRERVTKAIVRILANQSSSGEFGLWNSYGGGDTWLNAYVTDFLTRARESGYQVPDLAFTSALDNLENRLAYASDFQKGGEDIAYALYVLARNGRASMGDLRYYLDAKLQAFSTPLAKAQLAAGLALYGEQERAAAGFKAALVSLPLETSRSYRSDYGSVLRDSAAVTDYVVSASMGDSLVSEALGFLKQAQSGASGRSTQDMAWLLLAAQSLNKSAEEARISVDGAETPGRLAWSFSGGDLVGQPAGITNNGGSATDLLVSVAGKPLVPEPAGGKDYAIERTIYDLDGNPVDPTAVPVNTRLAVVVTVRALTDRPGRLMVVDRVPAGLVIDNPRLVRSGDLGGLSFLSTVDQPEHAAFHRDRFEVALDQTRQKDKELSFAYLARAATPGSYVHPPASVEDMYSPDRRAITATGRFVVLGPAR
ncbi:alpha-2-macroglobulin family protein [Roseibium aggregatum]|uniref:Alpha-2-macroglobulin family protein n=1 Tax=Roseibium aggregatum TaxID=187304 RepID=A0A939EAW4_9HYPH|nr:alpha-2-macroglobulin family protein [Roseibium aggregatum]MBN9669800.1 alpha-2-macroglobulin family protein [Roseibium aggregatum]